MHAADPHRLGVFRDFAARIAEGDGVQAIDGNFILRDEVALDRFGQPLGALDAGAAGQ